jgi:membrane-associated protein
MFNVTHLIETGGLLLIGTFVFAESGVMVGLFLPGDTLLMSAGVLAATGKLDIVSLCIVISLAAIAGDNVGYQIGKSLGPRLFRKKDGIIFRKEYINQAEKFYEKYGARAMLVEHFIPIIRSFAPVTAGAGKMSRPLFILCNSIGDIFWAVGFTLFGYYVGSKIPHIDKYIEPLIIGVILVFTLPALYHVLRDPRVRAAIAAKLRRRQPPTE